jgi:hypothetical protein
MAAQEPEAEQRTKAERRAELEEELNKMVHKRANPA